MSDPAPAAWAKLASDIVGYQTTVSTERRRSRPVAAAVEDHRGSRAYEQRRSRSET